jgi:hypothetical protein
MSTPPVSTSPMGGSIRRLSSKYLHKVKLKESTFLASLNDLDYDLGHTSSLAMRNQEASQGHAKWLMLADTTRGLYTMAIGEDMVSSDNKDINDNSTFNVSLSTGELTTKVVELMAALAN